MQTTEEDLLDTVAQLYDAALNSKDWPRALAKSCSVVASTACAIDLFDKDINGIRYSVVSGLPTELNDQYLERYAATDVRIPRALSGPNLSVYRDRDLLSEEEFRSFEPYHDLWIPHDFHYQLHGMVGARQRQPVIVTYFRGERAGHFDKDEIKTCASLLPHINRAARVAHRFGSLNLLLSGAGDAMDKLSVGVLLLGEQGEILYMNDAAHSVVGNHDGLLTCRSGLCATRPQESQQLQELIGSAIAVSLGSISDLSHDTMSVSRPSGKRPYSLTLSPVSRTELLFATLRPAAMVFIRDPEAQVHIDKDEIASTYGLTPAEATLASGLAMGHRLHTIADQRGVTVGTARNQLKAVFQKTCTHSQGELIALLLKTNVRSYR